MTRPDSVTGDRRTNVDAAGEIVAAMAGWLAHLDWLIAGAFLFTIGSFLGAVLDSYTSLCTVGGGIAHIGTAADCPDVHGWDTRTFALSIDMGWAGALLSTVRLAYVLGMKNWRWRCVLVFEVATAVFTVVGNSLHALIADGVIHAQVSGSQPPDLQFVVLTCLASAVPGVVAVGSGFTLNVLFSTRHATRSVSDEADRDSEREAERTADKPPNDPPSPPPPARKDIPKLDPKLARIARNGGTWRDVRKAYPELSDDSAQKRLAVARKALGLGRGNRPPGEAEEGPETGPPFRPEVVGTEKTEGGVA